MKILLKSGIELDVPKQFEMAVEKIAKHILFGERKVYTKPRTAVRWTESEDVIIAREMGNAKYINARPTDTYRGIGVLLNRSSNSVSSRAQKLGLVVHRN